MAEVERAREELTVGARLGSLFIKRGLKIADVVDQWDSTGNGEIDKNEFRHQVQQLGLQASRAAD